MLLNCSISLAWPSLVCIGCSFWWEHSPSSNWRNPIHLSILSIHFTSFCRNASLGSRSGLAAPAFSIQILVTQRCVSEPETLTSPKSLLEMQSLRLIPDYRVGLNFNKARRWFSCRLKCEKHSSKTHHLPSFHSMLLVPCYATTACWAIFFSLDVELCNDRSCLLHSGISSLWHGIRHIVSALNEPINQ